MSNVEWDSKVVIGQKAKAPKVTRTTSDLNGASHAPPTGCIPVVICGRTLTDGYCSCTSSPGVCTAH